MRPHISGYRRGSSATEVNTDFPLQVDSREIVIAFLARVQAVADENERRFHGPFSGYNPQ
jgi:hypothetical protein